MNFWNSVIGASTTRARIHSGNTLARLSAVRANQGRKEALFNAAKVPIGDVVRIGNFCNALNSISKASGNNVAYETLSDCRFFGYL